MLVKAKGTQLNFAKYFERLRSGYERDAALKMVRKVFGNDVQSQLIKIVGKELGEHLPTISKSKEERKNRQILSKE